MDAAVRVGRERVAFVFSYGEHEPWPAGGLRDGEDPTQAFVRHLRGRDWEPAGPADDPGPEDLPFRTVAALAGYVRDNYLGDPDQPAEVVELPFARLAPLMAAGGWSFVGGAFSEFEGNHNDTEIEVLLERQIPAASGADPDRRGV